MKIAIECTYCGMKAVEDISEQEMKMIDAGFVVCDVCHDKNLKITRIETADVFGYAPQVMRASKINYYAETYKDLQQS